MNCARTVFLALVSSASVTPCARIESTWAASRLSRWLRSTPWLTMPSTTPTPGRRPGAAGDAGVVLVHQATEVGGAEIADDDEDGVVRRVVGIEERLHVAQPGGVEVGHRADDRMRVGEAAGAVERGGEAVGERPRVGLVVHPEAALLLHRLALVVEV